MIWPLWSVKVKVTDIIEFVNVAYHLYLTCQADRDHSIIVYIKRLVHASVIKLCKKKR